LVCCVSISFPSTPRPPTSTLSPYTTLFRSSRSPLTSQQDAESRPFGQTRRAPSSLLPTPGMACPWRPIARRFASQCDIPAAHPRSEEHTSELQSRENLVCRLLLVKKKNGEI